MSFLVASGSLQLLFHSMKFLFALPKTPYNVSIYCYYEYNSWVIGTIKILVQYSLNTVANTCFIVFC